MLLLYLYFSSYNVYCFRVHENERNLHAFTKKVEDLIAEWELNISSKDTALTAADISSCLLKKCVESEHDDSEVLSHNT
jgi:hypothetical protein